MSETVVNYDSFTSTVREVALKHDENVTVTRKDNKSFVTVLFSRDVKYRDQERFYYELNSKHKAGVSILWIGGNRCRVLPGELLASIRKLMRK